MGWIISGILLAVIIILIINKSKQLAVDRTELASYQKELEQLKSLKRDLAFDVDAQRNIIEENNRKIKSTKDELTKVELQYNNAIRDRTAELDEYIRVQRVKKQEDLNKYFQIAWKDKEKEVELQYARLIDKYENYQREAAERADCATRASNEIVDEAFERANNAIEEAKEKERKYQSLIEPIRKYEMEINERLFYTVQVPEQAKEDIDYLINFAAKKVHNPDIISKIIWTEYIKPYLDQTFKRIEIKEEPGIYKITNIDNGKSYIGKSTNVKRRITDHYKGACGISTISKQLVHDEMATSGLWNWTIEVITYCERSELSDLEKYYISFFKSNSYGYNITKGGEG